MRYFVIITCVIITFSLPSCISTNDDINPAQIDVVVVATRADDAVTEINNIIDYGDYPKDESIFIDSTAVIYDLDNPEEIKDGNNYIFTIRKRDDNKWISISVE